MAKLKAKQIVDIQDSIFQQTGSVQSTAENVVISGSLIVTSSVVDFSNATSVSGSTFSGSFIGSGAGLTGVPASGIDGQLGIFATTGSFESTTNNLQVTGSVTISSSAVDLTGATAISGSTFSGSFVGSGAGLTGVPASGIDGQLGIFAQTGSIQATTNNLEVTGSAIITGQVTASSGIRAVGDSVVAGDLQVNDELIVSQYISHKDDSNTRFNFTDDRVQLEAGGINFFGAHKKDAQPHLFTINNGGNHIDFQIKDNDGDTLFRTDADGDNVLFPDAVKISGSAASTGSFGLLQGDGSELTGITSGIFQTTGSIEATTNDIEVTGSAKVNTAATSSTAIFTNNIQNGYPTSNNWGEGLDGSYFNNFDNTSHVSEILRFVAGIISHSIDTSSPTANTKTFGSVDSNESNLGTTDSIGGYLPTNYTALSNATLNYLVFKGWTSVGATIFSGISVYHDNGSSYFIDFDSNSAGSTTISSSADTELFGLGGLTSGGATEFKVRVVATHSFSDVSSENAPDESSNKFTTQSFKDLSVTDFGTSNGVTLAKIESANPAVIPAAFQDGKFANVGGTSMTGSLSRKYGASATDFTSVSSSGYYRFHDLKVGIASGSGNFQFVNGSTKNRFWAPIDTIDSAIGLNSLSDTGTTHKALTATSRSLSGVPYLLDSTFEVSTQISGLFNPMYASSTTLVDMTAASVGVGSVSISGDTISTNGGTIQTSGKVFQSDGTTPVNSGVPRYNDIAIVTASVSYDSGNADSINQSGVSDTSFTVATKARNRESSQSTFDTQTISYHTAGTFGQPVASGSLGIYGRAQGYDGGSLTGTQEAFSGEDFRIQLNNNVTSFAGDAFTTTFQVGGILGNNDLQVKPGFLVDPGGSYRYWYPADYGTGTYKYYIRRFQDGSTRTQMTVDVGKTLVNWNSTSDGVAVGLILKSGTSAGSNTSISTCRIFDPSATTSNLIEAGISNDNHKNPFSSNIDLYGNTGGSLSSTTYTVPIRNADGMFLDSSDNELYVIIRYKGDPSPVTTITLAFS